MLSDRVSMMECEQPPRPKHLRLTRIARNMIENLLTQNPREMLIDPDDVTRRGVLFFLDECCWAMMKQRAAAEEAARYQEQRRYPYYGRGIPGHEYYASPPPHYYGYRHPNDDYDL